MNPGVHAAIAAAEERRRKQQEEEEERMTRYDNADLEGDWEFKIVRSSSPVFRKPEFLQQVLEEEAQAGWQMLEKLDNNRIRLKRPGSAKRRDGMLPQGFDPYRTQIGGAGPAMAALIIGLGLLVLFGVLVMFLGFQGDVIKDFSPFLIIGITVLIALVAIAVKAARLRG